MKVIFLDIDGVLIPRASQVRTNRADPKCVRCLNELTAATEATIVVSSTWRLGLAPLELRKTLERWGVTARIVDRTPDLPDATRGREIKAWLQERKQWRGDVTHIAILDDHDDLGDLLPWLVRTDGAKGLSESDCSAALSLLSGDAIFEIGT